MDDTWYTAEKRAWLWRYWDSIYCSTISGADCVYFTPDEAEKAIRKHSEKVTSFVIREIEIL
jgi:hypothetical protein